jgi:hypothetical protein
LFQEEVDKRQILDVEKKLEACMGMRGEIGASKENKRRLSMGSQTKNVIEVLEGFDALNAEYADFQDKLTDVWRPESETKEDVFGIKVDDIDWGYFKV